MPLSQAIQRLIHLLEVGAVSRYLRYLMLALAIIGLAFIYDLRVYRNLAEPEAMDSAQLARNLAEGKGYTTLFIRPFSLYLVQSHNQAEAAAAPVKGADPDFASIKSHPHPDLANAPLYPLLLAGLMKILPFHYAVSLTRPFWSDNGHFWRYQPDFMIALFNQVLLLAAVALIFFLARKLFDLPVAWLTALLTLGCEVLWQFSVSGLSTLLLIVIFLGLAWLLADLEAEARETEPRSGRLLALTLGAGVLTGVGALTHYAFGWTIIPVALFLFFFSGRRRVLNAAAAVGIFAVVLTPWIVRNYAVSGTPFGTAGYAIVEGTSLFPQYQLERSLNPDWTHVMWFRPYLSKLMGNLHTIVVNLPRLGGSWASVLFLAGLLLAFRGAAVRRMRYFLLMCLATFMVVQALGRTQLSDESPEINSENLLVLLVPLVLCFGVSFFFTFLDQMRLAIYQLRYVVIAAFAALCCLPLIATVLSARTTPVVFPPYFPPDIQRIAGWMKPGELVMSDVPWAMAWYGDHQCVWLSLNAQKAFFAINDNLKPVQALYLTPASMDGRFISEVLHDGGGGWGNFVLQAVTQNQIPTDFSLRFFAPGITSGMCFADWQRWKTGP